jgi:hypothetical protein
MAMRLSEAIRLGAKMGPQAFGQLRHQRATCALGAAAQAIGMRSVLILKEWPWLATTRDKCPECMLINVPVLTIIPHLNDHHLWSRERIADWVETLENKLLPKQMEDLKSDDNCFLGMWKFTDFVLPQPRLTPVGWLDKLM